MVIRGLGGRDLFRPPPFKIMKTETIEEYFNYSRNLTPYETEQIKVFSEWLPNQIIDVHAHCNLPEHAQNIDPKMLTHMMTTFPYYSIDQSEMFKRVLFPETEVRTLRFPHVVRGIDIKGANDYLSKENPLDDRVALLGIPTDIEYTTKSLEEKKVNALKMYYIFFDPPASTIYQTFPKEILDVAQQTDTPIILHLPRMITLSKDDLEQTITDFPRLRIALAHLGLPHIPVPGLQEVYRYFSKFQQVYMDTAMIPSQEVVSMAIKEFGTNRIMFGSDEPLHLIRASVYHNPERGQRLITEYPYHWVDPEEHERFSHLASGVTHAIWPALNAIKDAIGELPNSSQSEAKDKIFHDNAKDFYNF